MLRSEWRAGRNTWRTAQGRSALLGAAIVLVCLAVAGLALGSMLEQPELIAALHDEDGGQRPVLALLCAALLLPPALLVLSFAKVPIRQQLFRGAHVPVLLASPVGSRRLVTMVWLRQTAGASSYALALVAAPAVALSVRAQLPIAVASALLVTVLMLVATLVAVVVLLMVVLVRWGSGGRLRQVLTVLHVAFATGVILLLLSGVGRGEDLDAMLRSFEFEASSLAAPVRFVAALPVACASGAPSALSIIAPLSCVGVVIVCLGLAAAGYRRAYEAFLCAGPARVVRHRGGSWPMRVVPSLLRRAAIESWRARGNLALLALLAAFTVYRVATAPLAALPDDPAPTLRAVFGLLLPWQLLASLLSMLLFLTVVGDEQKQLPLLATAPFSRAELLQSRIVLVGWPFVLILLLTAATGALVVGVSWLAVVGFVLAAVPPLLVLLASALAVGSWPSFIAVHDQVPLANNLRSVVPVLVLSAIAAAAFYGHYAARDVLLHRAPSMAPWLLAAAWLLGGVWFWLGCRVARGNLERLLGPQ